MAQKQNVAAVTGGAQGIWLACAKQLAATGSKVALWDFDDAALEAALSEFPNGSAEAVKVDIGDYAQVAAAVS